MVVERIGQSGVFSPCSNLREHSVCTNSVSHFRCSPVDAHIPVSPVVTGTVHPALSADSQEICRSVMENSEPSPSKSDLGLGIIDTACLFCVARSEQGCQGIEGGREIQNRRRRCASGGG